MDSDPHAPIYLDHAATSWPKPAPVVQAIVDHYAVAGGNPGRSGHRMSVEAARLVTRTREAVAELLGAPDASRIAFTSNATTALNVALYGLLRPGHHVVTTSLEHNSVMRPLRDLERRGVDLTVIACGPDGSLDVDAVRRAVRPTTTLIAATHASNVLGTVVPVAELTALARSAGVLTLIDAAQTAGTWPINIAALDVDLLAFTGHKGLLGPTGTGGLYVREGVALHPTVRGGTGSESAHEDQPTFMPDALESGTPNVAGLAGLDAALAVLRDIGVDAVRAHEHALVARFLEGAADIPTLTVHGPRDAARRCGVVSMTLDGVTPSDVGLLLDDRFGIMTRAGLHCAPAAHRTAGTFPSGTVRLSVGWSTTTTDIDRTLDALRHIASWARADSTRADQAPAER